MSIVEIREDGRVMMQPVSPAVKTFFAEFERASNTFEQDLLARQWSDPFMVADPEGGIRVVTREDFLAGVAKRQAFLHALGFQFVTIVPVAETRLDEHYVLVTTHAEMRFEQQPGHPIDLKYDGTYIVFIKGDAPRVVFSLTHEDLVKLMQAHGLAVGIP
jgi:hypothetical protein